MRPLPLTVVGAGGLLAGEALRLAAGHPYLELQQVVTRTPGTPLVELQPQLAARTCAGLTTVDLATATGTLHATLEDPDARAVVLLGLPHAETARTWRALREELGARAARVVVLDLSADYRLADPDVYARWYGAHEDPSELASFRYGLPELAGESLQGATRIAAPGCFATALQLACVPAARSGLLDVDAVWSLQAVTGSSGSGVKPRVGTHHPFRASNLLAYGLGGHRHEAELEQALDASPRLAFVPHSGPFVRGIHLTAVLPTAGPPDADATRALYAETFAEHPFVEVLDGDAVPELRRVVGSNRAQLAVHAKAGALVVLVALDNVVKGGAGQALQALNLSQGWPETSGLPIDALGVA